MDYLKEISLTDFMNEHKDEIRKSLDLIMKPTFKGLENPQKYSKEIDLLYKLPKTPFPRQARAIIAGYEHIKSNKSLILSAEMGTGKTLMSISMAFLRMINQPKKLMNFGIMSPTHLTKKWREEILAVLGEENSKDVEVFVVNSGAEMLKLGRSEKRKRVRFYIFSKEVAKLSYKLDEEESSFLVARKIGEETIWTCPTCGTSYEDSEVKENIKKSQKKIEREVQSFLLEKKIKKPATKAERMEARGLRNKINETTLISFCRKCKIQANLIQNKGGLERFIRGENLLNEQGGYSRKISIAQAVKSFNTRGFFEILFVDEMHEMKGGSTGQGLAFASLISGSKKIVGLTGTLLNGYVSSLFYILFRMFPRTMIDMGFTHSQESLFVKEFGGYSTTETLDDDGDKERKIGSITKRRVAKQTPKEIPVINPMLIKFLMPNIIFLKQDELNIALPDYEERVILVKKDINPAYERYVNDLLSVVKNRQEPNGRKLLGALANDSLSILDLPFIPRQASFESADCGKITINYNPDIKEDYITNKEHKLFALVKSEMKEKRKVLVYINFSGLGTGERVKDVLTLLFQQDEESAGTLTPRIRILDSNVCSKDRSEWIAKNPCEVLITNPELVKTGLDLYDYPTIIYHQTGYAIQTIKQASRRAWRIGQDKTCRVFFLISSLTPQEIAMSLIAKKLKASNDLEGRLLLTQNELTSLASAENDSLHEAMLKTLSGKEQVSVDENDLEAWVFKAREDDAFEAFFKSRNRRTAQAETAILQETTQVKMQEIEVLETPKVNPVFVVQNIENIPENNRMLENIQGKEDREQIKQSRKDEKVLREPTLFDFFGMEEWLETGEF